MKLIQISDLHIDETYDKNKTAGKIELMCRAIKKEVSVTEPLVFCFLGDLINKGIPENFARLSPVLESIHDAFAGYNISFEFIPGNHDLCPEAGGMLSTKKFNKYIKKYVGYSFSKRNSIHIKDYDDITLVLAASVCHLDHKYGYINMTHLANRISHLGKPYLVMTHHALFGDNDDDVSTIRNSNALASLMKSECFVGFLHGHTHGYKNIEIEKCRIIGVGPFLKDVPNINNQFNLIDIHKGQICLVNNFFYREDLGEYSFMTVYENKCNYYFARSVKDLYSNVTSNLKHYKHTFNLSMHLETSLSGFENDIRTYFGDYIKNAQDMLEPLPPSNMKYNHGQYWSSDVEVPGLDYVVNQLKSSPNTTRAVLPLISVNEVIKTSNHGKNQDLPALNIVQFTLDNNTSILNISMYFRSLEVNNFLKTNICEAFLCAERIARDIPFIKSVNLSIYAAVAQYCDGYKAGNKVCTIDSKSSEELTLDLSLHKFDSIATLLEEKKEIRNYSDTTVFDNMSKALAAVSCLPDMPHGVIDAFNETKIRIDEYNNLKSKKAMFSDLSEAEGLIDQAMTKLINKFRGISK